MEEPYRSLHRTDEFPADFHSIGVPYLSTINSHFGGCLLYVETSGFPTPTPKNFGIGQLPT